MLKKVIAIAMSFCFICEQAAFCQSGPLALSAFSAGARPAAAAAFRPMHLRYLQFDPSRESFSLRFDKGDIALKQPELDAAAGKLMEYFLTGLAMPNKSFWVNLRPDSPQDVIDPDLARTDLGRVLLEADLQLKKDTASHTSPRTPEGKQYWDSLYKKAEELYGTQDVSIPALVRPWIVPGEVIVREAGGSAYICKAQLKVMLEQDYLKATAGYDFSDKRMAELNAFAAGLMKKLIVPEITREVNSAKKYAQLRQVYYSLVMAQWFKQRFNGEQRMPRVIDSRDLSGMVSAQPWEPGAYFRAYQASFKNGEYSIKETVPSLAGQTVRTCVSGGMNMETGEFSPSPQAEKMLVTGTEESGAAPGERELVAESSRAGTRVIADGSEPRQDVVAAVRGYMDKLEPGRKKTFIVARDGKLMQEERFMAMALEFSRSLPLQFVPKFEDDYHLWELVTENLYNSYDAIASFFDPGLALKRPEGYEGRITVMFEILEEKGKTYLEMTFVDTGAGENAAKTQRKRAALNAGEGNYIGGGGNANDQANWTLNRMKGAFIEDYRHSTAIVKIPLNKAVVKPDGGGERVLAPGSIFEKDKIDERRAGKFLFARDISAYEKAYSYEKGSFVVWTQGTRKGHVYRIVNRADNREPVTMEALRGAVMAGIAEAAALRKEGRRDDALKRLGGIVRYLHQAYYGDERTLGLRDALLFDSQGQYNAFLPAVADLKGWLKSCAASAGYDISDLLPLRLESMPELHKYYYGKEIDEANGYFFPRKFRGFLTHGRYSSSLPAVLEAGGLGTIGYLKQLGITADAARWGDNPTPEDVSFWNMPGNLKRINGGYNPMRGLEFPIVFGWGYAGTMPGHMSKLLENEVLVPSFAGLGRLTHAFVPYFMIDEVRQLLSDHGYGHLQVLPLGFDPMGNPVIPKKQGDDGGFEQGVLAVTARGTMVLKNEKRMLVVNNQGQWLSHPYPLASRQRERPMDNEEKQTMIAAMKGYEGTSKESQSRVESALAAIQAPQELVKKVSPPAAANKVEIPAKIPSMRKILEAIVKKICNDKQIERDAFDLESLDDLATFREYVFYRYAQAWSEVEALGSDLGLSPSYVRRIVRFIADPSDNEIAVLKIIRLHDYTKESLTKSMIQRQIHGWNAEQYLSLKLMGQLGLVSLKTEKVSASPFRITEIDENRFDTLYPWIARSNAAPRPEPVEADGGLSAVLRVPLNALNMAGKDSLSAFKKDVRAAKGITEYAFTAYRYQRVMAAAGKKITEKYHDAYGHDRAMGPVVYNPAGGADVFNFCLDPGVTDLIIADRKRFGSPEELFRVESRPDLDDEYYSVGTNSPAQIEPVPSLGSVILERIIFGMGARIVRVCYFKITEDGTPDFLSRTSQVQDPAAYPNAVVEFEGIKTGARKRLWYIQHDYNNGDENFLPFIRKTKFQTLLVKSAFDMFSPGSRIFSWKRVVQRIIEPAMENGALVISDRPLGEARRARYALWGFVPSTLALNRGSFGTGRNVDFGPARLLGSKKPAETAAKESGKPDDGGLPGGIDMRQIEITRAEAVAGRGAGGDPEKIGAELAAVAALEDRGMLPSGRRVKELVVSCGSLLPDYQAEILECIIGIMRREEEEAKPSDPELKEALAMLGKT